MTSKTSPGHRERLTLATPNRTRARPPAPSRRAIEPLERRVMLAAAAFAGSESAIRGDWQRSFGADGYVIPGIGAELPAHATFSTDAAAYIWDHFTNDPRALARPWAPAPRAATTWYGGTFHLDLNLTDGQQHQVALHVLDWDHQARIERVEVIDPATGALLDTRTIERYTEGTYLVYNVTGHVSVRISHLGGANAVVGGLFLGGARLDAPNHAPEPGATTLPLPQINEDDTDNRGAAVADLLAQLAVTDDDPGALRGIAVTGVDDAHGTWQYTTGNNVWTTITGASDAAARLLSDSPANRIRFIPAPEYHGPATFTYRAWDRTIGVSGGTGDATQTGGTTAFSSAAGTATLHVANVDDAPVFPGMNTLNAQVGHAFQVVLPPATDVDSDQLTYAVTGLPPGMTFDPVTRTLSWTPSSVPGGAAALPQRAPVPLKLNGWNYDAVSENSVSPFAQPFDGPLTTYTAWFESGLSGRLDGLPAGAGPFTSQVVNSVTGGNSTFALRPYDRNNVLILKDFSENSRGLFLDRPVRLSSLAVLASSNRVGNFFGANVGFLRVEFYNDGDTGPTSTTDGNFPLPTGVGDPNRAHAARYDASTWFTDNVYTGGEHQAPPATGHLGYNADIFTDGVGFLYNRDHPVGMYETDISLVNGVKVNGVVTDISDKYIKAIYFRKADSAPGGATGIFALSGDPATATPPGSVDVTYSVSDGTSVVTRTVRIRVFDAAGPLGLAAPDQQTVNEHTPFGLTLTATGTAQGPLTFSADALPPGAALDPQTGQFSWTPTEQQQGTYTTVFYVTDGTSTASRTVEITVAETNAAPVVAPISNRFVAPGGLVSFLVSATDSDLPANGLTYSVTGLPTGASFDPVTRQFEWFPTAADAGQHTITFTVTDDGTPALNGSTSVTITVNPNNQPPQANSDSYGLNQGASLGVNAPGVLANDADPDGHPITSSLVQGPASAASFALNPDGSFTYTPLPGFSGQDTFTYVASDGSLASQVVTVFLNVVPVVTAPASAVFLGVDADSQGDWKDGYGADGHAIPGDSIDLPAYAQVGTNTASTYVWTPSTGERRALQRGGSADRLAATWYGGQFLIDLSLTDGQTHRVGFYFLDWDRGTRAMQLDLIDPATGALLDHQDAANFAEGKHYVYELRGHVQLRVTQISGPNAVLAGIFFGAGSAGTVNHAPVLNTPALALPPVQQGGPPHPGIAVADLVARLDVSDIDGANRGLAITAADQAHGVWEFSTDGGTSWSGVGGVSDANARLLAANPANRVRFTPTAGYTGPVSFTFRAWDQSTGVDGGTANASATGGNTAFSAQAATASAHVTPPPTGGTAAHFIDTDVSTRGNWRGVYGRDGHHVVGIAPAHPAYVTVTPAGASSWVWSTSPADPRSPQTPEGAGRIAATLYSADAFTVDLHFTDGQSHLVAAYMLDYDGASRAQRVDVIDADTGAVLDTRTITQFQSGQYLVWQLSGHVTLRVTNLGGLNAVLSGLFFG